MKTTSRLNDWQLGDMEHLPFRLYKVGGAVRDKLRGHPPHDQDFVVVGATEVSFLKVFPEAVRVGKDFPVYLVGDLGDVAFARQERRTGPKHTDFEYDVDPRVTLEEDLSRRDLTVNAMAEDCWGNLTDPFGGASDLELRVLRHVGEAFADDALRVFRLARFAAQFGYTIAPETYRVAGNVTAESLAAVSPERVMGELQKGLESCHPRLFFEALARSHALLAWFPELKRLQNVPAGPPEHHPEADSWEHTMLVLDQVAHATEDFVVRFAAMCHDFGKGLTDPAKWPNHHNHDQAGLQPITEFCERLRVPTKLKEAALLACEQHMRVHTFLEMRKGKMVDLVKAADRTQLKAEGLATVCYADAMGRGPTTNSARLEGLRALLVAAEAARAEDGQPIPEALVGPNRGLHVRNQKGNAVEQALQEKGYRK